jgi:uncharacterized protein DUF3891
MIVRDHPEGRLLITQPDHAALARRIMERWSVGLADSPRRQDILLAVEAHDNGWLVVDEAPIVNDAGDILDFIHVPDDIRQGVWPRSVARLTATPYAAALVAQHAIHIFSRYRERQDWQPFFAEMQRLRDEQLRAVANVPLDTLIADYSFLRLADLISLTFCNAWTDVQGEDHGYAICFEGSRVTLAPDPFEGREVAIEIGGRLLPKGPFASSAAARAAWQSAPRILVSSHIVGTSVC